MYIVHETWCIDVYALSCSYFTAHMKGIDLFLMRSYLSTTITANGANRRIMTAVALPCTLVGSTHARMHDTRSSSNDYVVCMVRYVTNIMFNFRSFVIICIHRVHTTAWWLGWIVVCRQRRCATYATFIVMLLLIRVNDGLFFIKCVHQTRCT